MSHARDLLLLEKERRRRLRKRREEEDRQLAGETTKQTVARLFSDPLAWIRACVARWPEGETLAPYQGESLARLAGALRRVALRKGRGAGGSATAALAVLWFVTTREAAGIPWKVLTTAGSWRQLERYLWPEIRLWALRLDLSCLGLAPLIDGVTLLMQSIKLTHGQAFALSSDNPELVEGGHAEQLLVLLDEAAAIPDSIWDSLEGSFASATGKREAYAFALSKPANESGRFFEICAGKIAGWWPRHAKLEEAVAANRVVASWAKAMAELWGEDSALYRNHVLAEFASGTSARAVIPLWAIEAAVERWKELRDDGVLETLVAQGYGVDVGTGQPGRDPSTIAAVSGDVCLGVELLSPSADPRDTETNVAGHLAARLKMNRRARAAIDTNGYGGGALAILREEAIFEARVEGFRAGAGSDLMTADGQYGFLNLRAETLYGMRERLVAKDSRVALPDDPTLMGELSEPQQKRIDAKGKIAVEEKDDIAKRLKKWKDREDAGGSTNRADAVCIAFWLLSGGAERDESRRDASSLVPGRGGVPVYYHPHDARGVYTR